MNVDTSVEASAHHLMASLAMSVPGDFGVMIRAIVGVCSESVGLDEGLNSESFERLAQAHLVHSDGDPNYTLASDIMPPARPVRWASNLLALCCRAYGQPPERAVPVGAC